MKQDRIPGGHAALSARTALCGLTLGVLGSLAVCGSAVAAPIEFTWNPALTVPAGLPGAAQFSANNIGVNDFANIAITGTGTFTENAVLTVSGFLQDHGTVPVAGLNQPGGYNMFAVVTAAGFQTAPPALNSGLTSNGVFTAATYTMYGSPTAAITLGNVGPGSSGALTISGAGTLVPLFSGSLVGLGTTGLTAPLAGGYSAVADLNLSLTACTSTGEVLPSGVVCTGNETPFFVNPLPAQLDLVISNFSATTSVTSLTPGSPGPPPVDALLNIDGGGGNLTFTTIPEPASLSLLGASLLGMGLIARRRLRS